ncbi:unnamed protein product [Fusarium graminearum]|nr:hypothetical protein FGRA07_05007 [Fusarium graminearum]CAG1985915.1 unnamed protein product [Fusarium graminearum]CAG2015640.1 unnamed protein product [Fusarium graminearum]
MKFSIVLFITAAMNGAMAQFQYTACGYHLVNGGSYVQADIAWAACGRTDTCEGKEWNTLFIYRPIPHGLPEMESLGFCSNGCQEDNFHDRCN